jgi:hypothetical protein
MALKVIHLTIMPNMDTVLSRPMTSILILFFIYAKSFPCDFIPSGFMIDIFNAIFIFSIHTTCPAHLIPHDLITAMKSPDFEALSDAI